MLVTARLARRTAAPLAIGLAIGLAGCAPSGPAADACPPGFVAAANESATEQGLGVSFTQAGPEAFEPSELLTLVSATCFLAFDGQLGADQASGTFAFATTAIDPAAFAAAAFALGYQESGPTSWVRADGSSPVQIITVSTPSGGGVLLDLAEAYPETQNVVASFRVAGR